ncbi:hypothetical protein ASD83_10160 [Devosia sp. Root685]|uniref:hypothetical protein n=1 Tax=Devosia sp. Root685 TaxID=1736587 RepID=UPI0006FCF6E0|nr:hypothetical protein [Devosia sp. Root685]KRA97488.1 hypothetical protein ASD83_10160 [Devosia sp. Root685]
MAILSLRPGAFRTRNPGRDAETDQARTETVRNAILMALADARRERDGLKQRMSMYYAQAATMLDTSEEYGTRAAADEAVIRTAEQSASNARKRVAQLEAQMEKFSALIGQLDGAQAETAAADADIA